MLLRILIALFVLIANAWCQSVQAAPAGGDKGEAQPATAAMAPVVFNGKNLFNVGRLLSFPAEYRAKAISERIEKLADDPLFRPGSITATDSGLTTDIISNDTIIMSITDADAVASGKARLTLAKEFAQKIRFEIEEHNREYSARSIIIGSLYTFIATVILVTIFIILWKVFPRVRSLIESWRGTRVRSIRLQSIELIHEDRMVAILGSAANGARMVLVIVLLYFYVTLVLSFFPWTRGVSAIILNYIISAIRLIGQQLWSYTPKIFFIAVILLVARYAIKLVKFLFAEIGRETITLPGFHHDWAEPTYKIVRFLILAFTAVVAFPYLPGSESPAFKGISIFLGVLFSLGSTSAVANIIAGVILIYMRAFKIGDRVKIADTIGDIVEKNLLVTRIRTAKNVDITLPNSMVLGGHISNYSSSAQSCGLILHTGVTIGFDAPWRKVHELLIAAASSTENILPNPAPFVLQTSLDDFYVRYELNAYTDRPQLMPAIYSGLHQNIQDRFNEAGVEIMSPHYTQLRDGNRIAIPEENIPEDYVPGGLRIVQTEAPNEEN